MAEVRRLRALQTPGGEAQPTEADMERVLELALGDMGLVEGDRCVGAAEHAAAEADQDDVERVIRGAITELRLLRSDEWLENALREIREGKGPPPISLEAMLAIFRKHRDGKA